MVQRPRVLVICGPTGVGKSRVVTHLVPDILGKIEIISADSMQVYRGMDIGTAKPSEHDQKLIPHHLIDIHDPDQQYTVGDFVESAQRAVEDIWNKGNLPVLSGGTGFYIKSLVTGFSQAPPSDPGLRSELETRVKNEGLEVLREELYLKDPQSWEVIGAGDSFRIIRALEMFLLTGKPRASFLVKTKLRDDWDIGLFVLNRDREELYNRINTRVKEMMLGGLSREVEGLVSQGLGPGFPGFQAIGYKEFFQNDSLRDLADPNELKIIEEAISQHTRNYAKRQLTFFRALPNARWITLERGWTEAEETALIWTELESWYRE